MCSPPGTTASASRCSSRSVLPASAWRSCDRRHAHAVWDCSARIVRSRYRRAATEFARRRERAAVLRAGECCSLRERERTGATRPAFVEPQASLLRVRKGVEQLAGAKATLNGAPPIRLEQFGVRVEKDQIGRASCRERV